MNYKIISENTSIINKASTLFTSLNMKEAIHIQEVDFWLIDASTLDKTAILSYKNRKEYSILLFIVNNDEEINTCLKNSFCSFIKNDFSTNELKYWYKFLSKNKTNEIIEINNDIKIDLNSKNIIKNNENINLTLQEFALLNAININEFTSTKSLVNILKLQSQTSVRTIINRIRKKTNDDMILHKRNYGYKLNIKIQKENKKEDFSSYIKELEEQNNLMQEIIDSSSVFIVTFIHKQLYCINKAFRDYLGSEIIKELWDETSGDFFQLINYKSKDLDKLKKALFTIGSQDIELYNFKDRKSNKYKVKTYYFSNLDKHLLIFDKR